MKQPVIKTTATLRTENEAKVLNEIFCSDGISRAALAKKLHMTKGGITPIVSRLLELGVIEELQTPLPRSSSGRRPVLLHICPDRCFSIAVDFSRKGFSAALVNLKFSVLFKDEYLFSFDETLEQALEALRKMVGDILQTNGEKRIIGLAIVTPGPIDYENCTILNPPNFFNWENVPVGDFLKQHFNLPITMFNNAEAHTLAELYCGYGRELPNFLQIIVDEGVGGGIILDRKLFRGSSGLGAEFGHISIDVNGEQCECGNRGCIELYASIPSLLAAVNEAYLEDRSSSLAKLDWPAFLEQLEQGDPRCVGQMEQEAFYLGNLLVSLCNIFDPSAIIIGSTLAQAKEKIVLPLERFVNGRTIAGKKIPILTSTLKNPSLIGAAIAVFEDFFQGKYGEIGEVLQA